MILFNKTITCTTDNAVTINNKTSNGISLLGSIAIIVLLVGVIFNGVVLIIIVKKNLFDCIDAVLRVVLIIVNIAEAILIGSVGIFYILLSNQVVSIEKCHASLFLIGIGYVLVTSAVNTIMAMVIELYLATVKPFIFESEHNNKFYIPILIVSIVLFSAFQICSVVFPKVLWQAFRFYTIIFLPVYLTSVFLLYRAIDKELERMQKRTNNSEEAAAQLRCRLRAKRFGKMIFGSFCIGYIPAGCILIFAKLLNFEEDREMMTYIYLGTYLLAHLNVIIFPLIFCLRIAAIKNTLKKWLPCFTSVTVRPE
ncbi:adenosine receptor A2a-like [Clytia hemisphaerica]|uniref:adenosine receptor A2a-like n=1 Tax=Clytia hemisphaerica TaxID=252671 RepID=UPI0034D52567